MHLQSIAACRNCMWLPHLHSAHLIRPPSRHQQLPSVFGPSHPRGVCAAVSLLGLQLGAPSSCSAPAANWGLGGGIIASAKEDWKAPPLLNLLFKIYQWDIISIIYYFYYGLLFIYRKGPSEVFQIRSFSLLYPSAGAVVVDPSHVLMGESIKAMADNILWILKQVFWRLWSTIIGGVGIQTSLASLWDNLWLWFCRSNITEVIQPTCRWATGKIVVHVANHRICFLSGTLCCLL